MSILGFGCGLIVRRRMRGRRGSDTLWAENSRSSFSRYPVHITIHHCTISYNTRQSCVTPSIHAPVNAIQSHHPNASNPFSTTIPTQNPRPRGTSSTSRTLGDLKPKPPHTTPILLHHALAFLLRILRCGEQHALISRGLFVFADAAGLGNNVC